MSEKAMTLTEAASQLGIAARKLYAELRTREIIGSKNIALPAYVQSGHFRVAYRSFRKNQYVEHQYAVTLVTPKGLSLLQQIRDELVPPHAETAAVAHHA